MFGSDWPNRPTTAKIGGDWFHIVESPATPILERMEKKTDHREKVLGALIALNADPGCIEAHMFLAEHSQSDRDVHAHLVRAIRTGRELWEPIATAQDDFAYWGDTATRPYMRAIAALGAWHAERGDIESATDVYNRLLTMNPTDNQGIRYRLAELDAVPMVVAPGM
jgi:hypothetical protein